MNAAVADALRSAVIAGDLAAMRAALAAGADIDQRDASGDTVLNVAAACGGEATILTLIAAGAALEDVGRAGATSLMKAVLAGHLGAARILVAAGARINHGLVRSVEAKMRQIEEHTDQGLEPTELVEDWRDFVRRLNVRKR